MFPSYLCVHFKMMFQTLLEGISPNLQFGAVEDKDGLVRF